MKILNLGEIGLVTGQRCDCYCDSVNIGVTKNLNACNEMCSQINKVFQKCSEREVLIGPFKINFSITTEEAFSKKKKQIKQIDTTFMIPENGYSFCTIC